MKLCLIAPVPPPYGGVSNWERIIEKEIRKDPEIELNIINIIANKRPTDKRTIFDRIFYSGYVMLRAYFQLKKLVRKRKVDVVHMTTSGGLGFFRDILLLRYLNRKRIPSVYHIHFGRTVLYREKNGWEWKKLLQAVKYANQVITIDKPTYEILSAFHDGVSYINNPIDTATYSKYHLDTMKKITYVGWIIKTKGIEELLLAFSAFNQENNQEYFLELIGPGSDTYINELKREFPCEKVEFVGELEHEQAMERLAMAEIFVLPSYTEGFPNVILEAMALKKPIIATNVGAIPEMLGNNGGILIEKQNVDQLITALKCFVENEEYRISCGNNAYKKVKEEYDIANTFRKYKMLWRKL